MIGPRIWGRKLPRGLKDVSRGLVHRETLYVNKAKGRCDFDLSWSLRFSWAPSDKAETTAQTAARERKNVCSFFQAAISGDTAVYVRNEDKTTADPPVPYGAART